MPRPLFADENVRLLKKKIYALRDKLKNTKDGRLYEDAVRNIDSLEQLLVKKYCVRDNQGLMPVIGEEDCKTIGNAYYQVYYNLTAAYTHAAKEDLSDLQDILNELSWSMNALNGADLNKRQNIFEIFEDKDDKMIILDSEKYSSAGAVQSSRIPVEYKDSQGKLVKGFFTPESKVDAVGQLKNFFNSFETDDKPFSDLLNSFWAKYVEKRREAYYFVNGKYDGFTESKAAEALFNELRTTSFIGTPYEAYRKYNAEKTFALRLALLHKQYADPDFDLENPVDRSKFLRSGEKLVKAFNHTGFYLTELKTSDGVNIDKRNSAMSDVAAILGIPDLICHSSNMQVNIGGKMVNGTFMEDAVGYDIKHMPSNCPAYFHTQDDCEGLKDVFNLQVLDYICGNIDRHGANVLYKYDNKGKFTGVQGIDNDCAFGTQEYTDGVGINRLVAPEQMKYMTKSMYNKVMGMKDFTLRFALLNKDLETKEINSAVNRLHHLQDVLKKENSPIKVVPDDYFKGRGIESVDVDAFPQNSSIACIVKQIKYIESDGPGVVEEGEAIEKNKAHDLSFADVIYNEERVKETGKQVCALTNIDPAVLEQPGMQKIINSLSIIHMNAADYVDQKLTNSEAAALQRMMKTLSRDVEQFITDNADSQDKQYQGAVNILKDVREYCVKQTKILKNVQDEYNKKTAQSINRDAAALKKANIEFNGYKSIESMLYETDEKGNIKYEPLRDPKTKQIKYRHGRKPDGEIVYFKDQQGNKIPELAKKNGKPIPIIKKIKTKNQAVMYGKMVKTLNEMMLQNGEETSSYAKVLLSDALAELRRSKMTKHSGLKRDDVNEALFNIDKALQIEGNTEKSPDQIKETQAIEKQKQGLSV